MSSETVSQPSNETTPVTPDWGLPVEVVYCPTCKTSFAVPDREPRNCPVCFSARLEPQSDARLAAKPELIVPFTVNPAALAERISTWAKGVWIHPPELDARILTGRLVPYYFPMWLVDGVVTGSWQAQAGYEYQVASTTEGCAHGQWNTQQVTETRIRWEPRAGTLQRGYNNLAVPALEIHNRLRDTLGAYPVEKAAPFAAPSIQKTPVRQPDVAVTKAWPFAKGQFDAAASRDCRSAAAAQQIDQFSIEASYEGQNWTLLLLPVYSTFYHDDENQVQTVMINGSTGQIAGVRKASQSAAWRRTGILAGFGIICIVIALLISLTAAIFPPAVLLSGILFIVGIFITVASPAPAIWAWQYSRAEKTIT